MNTKKLGLLAIAGVSLVTLAGCASTTPQTQELSEQDMSAQVLQIAEPVAQIEIVEPVSQVETTEQKADMQVGMYADYNPAAVQEALNNGKKVALFFHASRCPSCRKLDRQISQNIGKLPEGSVTFKVDYDAQTELRQKYKVTSQHTIIIVDQNQEEVSKDMGTDLEKLVSMLQ